MKGKVWNITDKENLVAAALELINDETLANTKGASVLALYGDLGAGKTTLTQVIGENLGVNTSIVSPTFVVMKRYETNNERFRSLIHIDAYRLESLEELEVLGFKDWLNETDTLMVIEWADKVEKLLPDETLRLKLSLDGEDRRLETVYGS